MVTVVHIPQTKKDVVYADLVERPVKQLLVAIFSLSFGKIVLRRGVVIFH